MVDEKQSYPPLGIFRGYDKLCGRIARLVIGRERPSRLGFVSPRSQIDMTQTGRRESADDGAVLLIDNGRRYEKSGTAVRSALLPNKRCPAPYCPLPAQ